MESVRIERMKSFRQQIYIREVASHTIHKLHLVTVLMRSSIFPPSAFLLRWIVTDRWLLDAFTQVEVKKFSVREHG